MSPAPSIKLAVIDDHKLFRKGLISLIEMVSQDYSILFEADNGRDLQQKIDKSNLPDIVLMDVNMPSMDGIESVQWLKEHYPEVKVLVVSMIEKEEVIVKMLKLGVKGYLCKDVEPIELKNALHAVSNKGFYYTDFITGKLVHSLQTDQPEDSKGLEQLNEREKHFLQLACSEMTYHEIADIMFVSPKTVDGYRNSLFEKLNVKSRVGMVIHAIKNGFVNI
ncbi:MAG: response regulator transcription factor [Cyclobacteriaceae bacterium]